MCLWWCDTEAGHVYQLEIKLIGRKSINKPMLWFHWIPTLSSCVCIPATYNICIQQRVAFIFFLSFFYGVKSPCTNPTVLLLSSRPWKWTGCKTCRVHISQISSETPPQTLLPHSNSYLYLCRAQ